MDQRRPRIVYGSIVLLAILIAAAVAVSGKRNLSARNLFPQIANDICFRNMVEKAPVLLWITGRQLLCHYVNQSWLDFTGRRMGDELGSGWRESVHPDDLENCRRIYDGAFDAQQPFCMEYRLRRHDGQYRWMRCSEAPLFDVSGGFEGYIGSVQDVTSMKQMEREVVLANERLRLALEAGRAGLWEWDIGAEENIRFGNLSQLFGTLVGPETMQQLWQKIHPEDWTAFRKTMDLAKRNKTAFVEEFRVLWPDGVMHWLHAEGKFLYSGRGNAERILAICTDVSQRRRAEEDLEKSEQEFSLAFEAARLGWWVWNEETGYVIASEGAKAVHGRTTESDLTPEDFLNSIYQEERDQVQRAWQQSLDVGGPFFAEYRVQWPDGSIHWIEARGRISKGPGDRWTQMLGVCMEITERKRADEALRTLGGRLIEAQEQERVRIARELHDDICQRLAIVVIDLEELQQQPELERPELQRRTERLTQLTREVAADLQALSHELHTSKLEILGLAAAMKSFCAEFAAQHHVTVDFAGNHVSFPIPRDVTLCLYRVLQEALHNAVKHSGGRRFSVQLKGEPAVLELTVKDFGIGFSPVAARGRGLGLMSMRERVNMIKGTMQIESRPMQGTTIRVRVPVEEIRASRCA